jgi:enoyl-CoA hydratase/carnithine racemase
MGIEVSVEGHVAVIELQEPPHNFLHVELVESLAGTLEGFEDSSDVRAALLCAQGRSFCAGADFGRRGDPVQGGTGRLYAAAARLCGVATPVVAVVHGPAVGGGLGLAMTATLRVTCPEARWAANFAALGIHPGFGLSVTLPDQLGPSRAAQVLLSARRYTGEEAVAIGLADRCVPAGRVRDEGLAMAAEIAANAPLALRSIQRTLRAGLADRVRAATVHEADQQRLLSATADAREGRRAVAERRPASFTGT